MLTLDIYVSLYIIIQNTWSVFLNKDGRTMMFNSQKTRYTCRMKLGKPFNLSPNISYIWRLLICIIFILQHRLRSDNWAYPPLSVGVSPNSEQKLTDIRREATTVTTALRARPHLDFTISIFPVTHTKKTIRDWSMSLNN